MSLRSVLLLFAAFALLVIGLAKGSNALVRLPEAPFSGEPEQAIRGLLTESNGSPDSSLTVAMARAVESRDQPDPPAAPRNSPGNPPRADENAPEGPVSPEEWLSGLPPEVIREISGWFPGETVIQELNQEKVTEALFSRLESLSPDDFDGRFRLFTLAQTPGLLASGAMTRLGLRQLERATPGQGVAAQDMELLRMAGQLVGTNTPSLSERAAIYSQISPLHPSSEARQVLQRALFPHFD